MLSRLVHAPLTPIRYSRDATPAPASVADSATCAGATTVLSGALPLIVADVAGASRSPTQLAVSGVKWTWSNAAVRFHGAFCWPPAYGPISTPAPSRAGVVLTGREPEWVTHAPGRPLSSLAYCPRIVLPWRYRRSHTVLP